MEVGAVGVGSVVVEWGRSHTPAAVAWCGLLAGSVWNENWFDDNSAMKPETRQNIFFDVGCSVNCVNREFTDDSTDLSIKVPGGRIEATRLFSGNEWGWSHEMKLPRAADVIGTWPDVVKKQITSAGRISFNYALKASYPSVVNLVPTEPTVVAEYAEGTSTLTLFKKSNEYYWRWRDKFGNWEEYNAEGRLRATATEMGRWPPMSMTTRAPT